MLCMTGFLTLRLSVCVFVCLSVCVPVNKISKKILNLSTPFFCGSLPCDPGGKPFDFEKNRLGLRVGGCV